MSAPPPPPPAVIGSGKPHTVALKPGSNVAARQTARKRDEDPDNGLTARLLATLRSGEKAAEAAKRAASEAPAVPAPADPDGEAASAASPATGLSSAIRQRIAQLKQRNEAVSSELDRLPAKGKRAR